MKAMYEKAKVRFEKAALDLVAKINRFSGGSSRDPWRCEVCGSLNVQQRAWVDVNSGEIVRFDDCDRSDYWCDNCESNYYPVRESELLQQANEWWGHKVLEEMERITGFRRFDFDPEDSEQAFVDACDKWWRDKTIESKISIYCENQ